MNHYKLIKALVAEIRQLRSDNEYFNEATYSQKSMEKKNRQLREENNRIERERYYERQQCEYREMEQKELMNKLERAGSWGDEWGVDRIKRQLKSF